MVLKGGETAHPSTLARIFLHWLSGRSLKYAPFMVLLSTWEPRAFGAKLRPRGTARFCNTFFGAWHVHFIPWLRVVPWAPCNVSLTSHMRQVSSGLQIPWQLRVGLPLELVLHEPLLRRVRRTAVDTSPLTIILYCWSLINNYKN